MTQDPGVLLDYNLVLEPGLGAQGIPVADLDGVLAERFSEARETFDRRRDRGELGFLDLTGPHATAEPLERLAHELRQGIDDFVVLGIGGSSLGGQALVDALAGPDWNERPATRRRGWPRVHFVENVDPHTIGSLLARLDLRRTHFNVVSKSGSTAETMAQLLVVRARLEAALAPEETAGRLLFTTDPTHGVLRRLAQEAGVKALEIPPRVGGRFSALSPVGLFPAAMAGVPVQEILAGAESMEARCRVPELRRNPAGLFATLLHEEMVGHGRGVHVFMPYSDRLRKTGLWFQQLWAESLGKMRQEGGGSRGVGPTPVAALGATDQHSLLQLLIDGPPDKVVIFVAVDEPGARVVIPPPPESAPELSYLAGSDLGHLLEVERRMTAEALRRSGRPSMTLHLPDLSPRNTGGLLVLLEIATIYAGALLDVDPLDQPGVELGKELTYGVMGREGYDPPPPPPWDPAFVA